MEAMESSPGQTPSFYERPQVQIDKLPFGHGVPIGIEQVCNPAIGIGGAYGSWGESYNNTRLPELLAERLGEPLGEGEIMNLSDLGFDHRHHLPLLPDQVNVELELEVGARFLSAAMQACGWKPSEVDGVLIGVSGPVTEDYTESICRKAGIPDQATKVSVHKACDSSMGSLHVALNPGLSGAAPELQNLAETLRGKKVLVGGIEGLSRFVRLSHDKNALQLFGNGAGVIGVIPDGTMKFLVGRTHEVFDDEGLLKVRMLYPYTHELAAGQSRVEVSQAGPNHIRVAGMMHEPHGEGPVEMAGLMGMVKLFVRSGVDVVREVYHAYQERMALAGQPDKSIAVAIVHHANLKINKLKEKHLQREGIQFPMPWLLTDFGNVSAASNMIAFLRQLPRLRPGDHVLFDGFGAGTYYDALAVEMGG